MSRPSATSRKSTKSSFLRQTSFTPLTPINDSATSDYTSTKPILKKKLKPSRPSSPANESITTLYAEKPTVAENKRPKALRKRGSRPSSIFGSFRNFRLQDDDAVVKSAAETAVEPPALARKGTGAWSGGVLAGEKSNGKWIIEVARIESNLRGRGGKTRGR